MSVLRAALFPGQGVQRPGMAEGLAERAPEVFAEGSLALGVDLVELCAGGRSGEADLAATRWAQPAVLAVGLAAFEILGERFDALAGHSLGEYTALAAAGALGVGETMRLVALRGQVMDEACARSPGGMAAVLGLDEGSVAGICERCGVHLAADNAPWEATVAGSGERLEEARQAVEEAGGRWKPLRVSGAFHSPAMGPAAERLRPALDAAPIVPPRTPVWSATTAGLVHEPGDIRAALVAQLTAPVRFRETLLALHGAGVRAFCDVGPGRVLAGLVRRTVPGADVQVPEAVAGLQT